jgi:hypothetical protein
MPEMRTRNLRNRDEANPSRFRSARRVEARNPRLQTPAARSELSASPPRTSSPQPSSHDEPNQRIKTSSTHVNFSSSPGSELQILIVRVLLVCEARASCGPLNGAQVKRKETRGGGKSSSRQARHAVVRTALRCSVTQRASESRDSVETPPAQRWKLISSN